MLWKVGFSDKFLLKSFLLKKMPDQEFERMTKVQNDPLTQYLICSGTLKYWKKLTGLDFNYYFKEIDYVIYYKKNCRQALQRKLSEQPELIHKFFNLIRSEHEKYILWCETLKEINLKELSLLDLKGYYQEFEDRYQRVLSLIYLPFDTEAVLNQKIASFLPADRDLNFCLQVFSAPDEHSSTLLERLDLLKIAAKMKKGKVSLEERKKLMGEHQRRFSWLGILGMRGQAYSQSFYEQQLERELKGDPEAEYRKLKKIQEEQEQKVNSLLEEIEASEELRQTVADLRQLVFLRTWRLEQLSKGNAKAKEILNEIGRRNGFSGEEMVFLLPREVDQLLEGEKMIKEKIVQRQRRWCLIFDEDKVCFFEGEEAERLAAVSGKRKGKEMVLSGQAVSLGKYKGRVKIINKKEELNKIKKGDVLVTEMTTPDFVPAMERAGAIVTDIGGLTCHAAIVAREMGKPCVVGTERATKVFKDNELVEVDAVKGIVKMLKS